LNLAIAQGGSIAIFCLTLAFTGARISEVLALVPKRIDVSDSAIVFETLKQRKRGVFRALPISRELLTWLETTHELSQALIDPERKRAVIRHSMQELRLNERRHS
jgi:integrase